MQKARSIARRIRPLALLAAAALIRTPASGNQPAGKVPFPGPIQPAQGTDLQALVPLVGPVLNALGLTLAGSELNVTLVGGEKATAGDCWGVEVRAGQFRLRFGHSEFHVDPDGLELEFSLDELSLTGIKVKTKSPASACQWVDTFEVGGSAHDIKVVMRFSTRISLDDCQVVRLGDFSARVSIGSLSLPSVPGQIEDLLEGIIEDGATNALNILAPDLVAAALGQVIQAGICETKLLLYEAYMDFLGSGVEMYALPASLVEQLQPHYPTVDLRSVRFGYRWQPQGNNTTDCNRVYFSDAGMVDRLRLGGTLDSSEWNLVFHELQHTEQCARLGGRESFAKRWFKDLEVAALVTHLSDPISYLWELHDAMPMEQDATGRSNEIVVVAGKVQDAATGELVGGIIVSAYTAGAPVLATTPAVASDVTSTQNAHAGHAVDNFTFFLEEGSYDLYVRAPRSRFERIARRGVEVRTGDLEVNVTILLGAGGVPQGEPAPEATFRRGDVNASGDLNISDALQILGWLFSNGQPAGCEKAADVNDDGAVNIADPIALLGYMFLGSSEPPAPFAEAGVDPTPDALTCEVSVD